MKGSPKQGALLLVIDVTVIQDEISKDLIYSRQKLLQNVRKIIQIQIRIRIIAIVITIIITNPWKGFE